MPVVVRCPRCDGLSRVEDSALGLAVACPRCAGEFVAEPDRPAPPRPSRNPTVPIIPTVQPRRRDADLDEMPSPPRKPVSAVIGIALVPMGIPLAWLIAPLLGLGKPIFSFAAPVSLALGLFGLGVGIAYCFGWSAVARVRAIIGIVLVGYILGLALFLANADWAVAVRRNLPAPGAPRVSFTAPGAAYSVKVPGTPEELPVSPLAGWDLAAFRTGPRDDRRDGFLQLVYEFAHGRPPGELRLRSTDDDEFFDAIQTTLRDSTGGEVTADPLVDWRTDKGMLTIGDFAVALPDGARRRAVRVVRDRRAERVYYLAVEGAFLPRDLNAVQLFFNSLSIPAK